MEDFLRSLKTEPEANNSDADGNSGVVVDDQTKPSDGDVKAALEGNCGLVSAAISHIDQVAASLVNNTSEATKDMIPYLEFTIKTVDTLDYLARVNFLGYGPDVYYPPGTCEPWRIPKNELFCKDFFAFLLSKLGPHASKQESDSVELPILSIYELRIELKRVNYESSIEMIGLPQGSKRLEHALNDIIIKHCMNNEEGMNDLFVAAMALIYQGVVFWDVDKNILLHRREAKDTSIYIHNEHWGTGKQTCFNIAFYLKGFSLDCRNEVQVTVDNMSVEFKDLTKDRVYAFEEYKDFYLNLIILRSVCHLRQRSIRALLLAENWTLKHKRSIVLYGNVMQSASLSFVKEGVVISVLIDNYVKNTVRMVFSFSPEAAEQKPSKDFWRNLPADFNEFQMTADCDFRTQIHDLLNFVSNSVN